MKIKNIAVPKFHKEKLDKVKWHLWHGNSDTAIIRLEELIELCPEKTSGKLIKFKAYIENNIHKIVNYNDRKENVLPLPIPSLFTAIFPPWRSTRLFDRDRPSPVPWNLRLAEFSTCSNGRKIFPRSSGLMPIPVSVTEITIKSSVLDLSLTPGKPLELHDSGSS